MNVVSMIGNIAAEQAQQASAHAAATTSTSPASSAGNNTISSSDFLTLLVTQLKNQDPTQPTDPTQYVTQLVGVNSLQQLIDINNQLTALGGSASGTSSTKSGN